MHAYRVFLAGVVALTLVSAAFAADEEVNLKDVKCVLNPKGDAQATSCAEYKGGKVYFCCDNCKGKFTAEPKEYAVSANKQLFATKQFKQVKCPIMGKDVKEGVVVKVAGVEVGLCCPGCEKKVIAMDEKDQLEAVFGEKAYEKCFELDKKEAK